MSRGTRPGGARDQVSRLLALVPLIQREGAMSVTEAADRLGMDAGQLVKDLRVLMFCGWPGWLPGDLIEVDLDALDGEGMVRIHNADYLSTPVRLSTAEASAITVALRTLRETAPAATVDALDRALAKIEAVVEQGHDTARVDVQVAEPQRATAALRQQLASALADRRQVRLTYYVPARDENTERTVDPIAVLDRDGLPYLQAWCHLAGGRRFFRLDRVVAAETLATSATEHPDVAPLPLDQDLFRPDPRSPTATLRLAPAAAWVTEYYPVEAVRDLGGGALEVDLLVGSRQWLISLVLRLAPHARIVAPQAWADDFEAVARATLGLHG